MLCNKNESLESRNFIDGIDFTRNDPCLFVVYPPGAAGDLLISIIDKHYLQTGCEYYGIGDNGRVHMFTTDYEALDVEQTYHFDNQWFYNLAANLGNRNLNYSLLDQVIFGCHMYQDSQVQHILDTFPKCKIIRILPVDEKGNELTRILIKLKLNRTSIKRDLVQTSIDDNRVLNIAFGSIFNEKFYYQCYDSIIDFLNFNGRLICFDYVKYWLSKHPPGIQQLLIEYSKNL